MKERPVLIPLEGVIGSRSSGPVLPESAAQAPSMTVTVDGAARQLLDQARTRLVVVGLLFLIGLSVVAGRLTMLALSAGAPAEARAAPAAQIVRADILDRNGQVLATSIPTESLFADPARIIDATDAAEQLSKLFPDLGYGELLRKLQGKGRFVWIKRHLAPRQHYAVDQLGIPGIGFQPDERRLYSEGGEVAQVIGYTDIDSHGIAGIEKSFDGYLAKGTAPLTLSIDIRLQHILPWAAAA
jgi:cell division protein FtsI (penicillin-binding protein 3)